VSQGTKGRRDLEEATGQQDCSGILLQSVSNKTISVNKLQTVENLCIYSNTLQNGGLQTDIRSKICSNNSLVEQTGSIKK